MAGTNAPPTGVDTSNPSLTSRGRANSASIDPDYAGPRRPPQPNFSRQSGLGSVPSLVVHRRTSLVVIVGVSPACFSSIHDHAWNLLFVGRRAHDFGMNYAEGGGAGEPSSKKS